MPSGIYKRIKPRSEDTKLKISRSLLGHTHGFKKGITPWNKGTKGIMKSNKTSFKKGQHYSPKTEFKKGENCRENHPLWKGGVRKLKNGYVLENCLGHPRAYRNEVYQHILVAEKKIGRHLDDGEVIHHLNGVRDDNRPENLVVCINNADHLRQFHSSNRWSRKYNECVTCKTDDKGKYRHTGFGLCSKCFQSYRYHKKMRHIDNVDNFIKYRQRNLL
jgi:ribosomal protein S14